MNPTLCVRAVAAALFFAVSAPIVSAAKVEEQVLLPKLGNAQIIISPTGGHVAAVMAKGSRVVVVYDGVESQKFDTLLNADGTPSPARSSGGPTLGGPVIFSADGEHYAYSALQGDEYIAMLDGKELLRLPFGEPKPRIEPFEFSPVGNHFLLGVTSGNSSDPKEGFRLYVDGKPGPTSRARTETNSHSNTSVLFSPDGTRYAYIGTNTRDLPEGKWAVANGKQVKFFGNELQFTAHGRLLSVVTTPGVFGTPPTPGSQTLLLDAKPVLKALWFGGIWVSPTSDDYAVVVTPKEGAATFLTLNGKPVPGTENAQIGGVYFSPDGKRLAVLCTPAGATTGSFMILDGKKGPKYQSIEYSPPHEPSFSADSSKFIYVANNNGHFLVVNSDESDAGFSVGPYLGAGGSRLAYALQSNGGNELFVDDKSVFKGALDNFSFSTDGAHYAFIGNQLLYLDGAPVSNFPTSEWMGIVPTGMYKGQVERYRYVFSPDGKHLTYLAGDPNNEAHRGLWIDKKFIFRSPSNYAGSIYRPTFTPDSKHLFWYDRVAPSVSEPQGHFQLYVDGEMSMTFPPAFFSYDRGSTQGGTWEVSPDGTLQLIAIGDNSIKRYRITPSPERTIETLVAKEDAVAGPAFAQSAAAGNLPPHASAIPADVGTPATVAPAVEAALADPVGAAIATTPAKAKPSLGSKAKSWLKGLGSDTSTSTSTAAATQVASAVTQVNSASSTAAAAIPAVATAADMKIHAAGNTATSAVANPGVAAANVALQNASPKIAEAAEKTKPWLDALGSTATAEPSSGGTAQAAVQVGAAVMQANTTAAQSTNAAAQIVTQTENAVHTAEAAVDDPAGTAVDKAAKAVQVKTAQVAAKTKSWLKSLTASTPSQNEKANQPASKN